MSKQYTGGLITKTPVVPTSLSAPGVWSLSDQAKAQATNTWPFPRDPQFNYVTMLLHGDGSGGPTSLGMGAGASPTVTNFNADASTNNFNVTINGDARSDNFTPYQEGYYSNYFDGTGDYFTYAPSTTNQFGTGSFTVEAWYYPLTDPSGANAANIYDARTASVTSSWVFGCRLNGSGSGNLLGWYNGSAVLEGSALTLNTWNHIVYVRDGGTNTGSLFLNGTRTATQTDSTNYSSTGATATIGSRYTVAGYINGYLSNLRLVKGTAVYSASSTTITVPTTPLTAITNTSLLTCQSNRFIDNSTNAFTITKNGDTAVSPAQPFTLPSSVATYGSGYFGSANYLSAASNAAFGMGTGDFTVEAWVYPNAAYTTYNYIWATGANGGLVVYVLGGVLYVRSYNVADLLASSVAPTLNAWSHVAVTRSGTTLRIFVNGVQTGTTTNSTNFATGSGLIGNDGSNAAPWYGQISDLRVVKGTAVYTSAFTPPTTPLTAITNTSLLTTQYNGGGNNSGFKDSSQFNFPITRNGNTTQGTFTPYGSNWSNYFNGVVSANQSLTASPTAVGTSNFTVEFWFYYIGANSDSSDQQIYDTGTNGFSVYISGGAVGVYNRVASSTIFSTVAITANSWVHIAFVRSGTGASQTVLYINGTSSATATLSTNFTSTTVSIGGRFAVSGASWNTVNGYVSNVRYNSTAVYSGAFTPSTTPLTAISGTVLLTCQSNRFIDNSTNAYTITVNSSPSVQRFSPFAPLTVYNPATYGGSAYFDGSDGLVGPTNTSLAFGSSNFTVEFWANIPSTSGTGFFASVWEDSGGSDANASWLIRLNNNGTLITHLMQGASTYNTLTSGQLQTNSWFHCAYTRSGGTIYLFINGVLAQSAAVSGAMNTAVRSIKVGYQGTATNYLTGYVSNLHVINGTCLYASAFTPPTAPLTAISNTQFLLSATNPAILDNAMINNAETVGNTQVSTSVKKYGAASMYFDGSGDGLYSTSQAVTFGTGDFTIEFWVYFVAVNNGVAKYFYDMRNSGATSASFFAQEPGNSWTYWNGAGTSISSGFTSSTFSATTWFHVAICRSSGVTKFFANGTQTNSVADTSNYATSTLTVGNRYSYTEGLNAYIDDLRITKYARYTATFTPPTQAFPNG